MTRSGGPITSYRSLWLPELVVLAALSCSTLILFVVTDLDIAAARWFHHPELPDPWPVALEPLWYLFYRSAPWITGSLAAAGTAALIAGLLRKEARTFRIHGLFILLCVAIGPGLIVSGILKDHWGRARQRQIVEFGGRQQYTQPLARLTLPGDGLKKIMVRVEQGDIIVDTGRLNDRAAGDKPELVLHTEEGIIREFRR